MAATAERNRDLRARFDRLTAREREIVARIVASPGEVSSKEVGRFLGISPRTVDVYRARLMRKLGASTTPELVNKLLSG